MESTQKQKVGAIIAAGGSSRRMDGVDKLFAPLGGRPVLERVVATFENCPAITEIVIVLAEANLEKGRQLMVSSGWSKVSGIYPGGPRRQDSVAIGLSHLKPCDWVLIHDGARPLVTEALIDQVLDTAQETGAAIVAVPVTDTIKLADDENLVRGTLPRQHLWAVQTPQAFHFDIITRAFQQVQTDVTDDATLVEQAGYPVKICPGSYANIKVTTPDDFIIAEALWQKHGK